MLHSALGCASALAERSSLFTVKRQLQVSPQPGSDCVAERGPWLQFPLVHVPILPAWILAIYSTSLNLTPLICEVGIMTYLTGSL